MESVWIQVIILAIRICLTVTKWSGKGERALILKYKSFGFRQLQSSNISRKFKFVVGSMALLGLGPGP